MLWQINFRVVPRFMPYVSPSPCMQAGLWLAANRIWQRLWDAISMVMLIYTHTHRYITPFLETLLLILKMQATIMWTVYGEGHIDENCG